MMRHQMEKAIREARTTLLAIHSNAEGHADVHRMAQRAYEQLTAVLSFWHVPEEPKRRTRDPVRLAKQIGDIAIGEAKDTISSRHRPRKPATKRAK